jgi:trehalose/maltose transport system substrate-binding protein
LALSTHSLYPEQAARFMAFLVDREQQLHIARQSGQLPALETVYHDPELLAEQPIFQDLQTALANTRGRPQSPAYLALSEAIWAEVNKMLRAEQDAATTAAIIQRRLESILH